MNEISPQSDPNAPPPPPSEFHFKSRWRNNGLLCAGVVLILFLIALASQLFFRKRIICDVTEQINNARQIGIALDEFNSIYGSFPDDTTIAKLKEDFPASTIPLDIRTSNDYFRQLIVAGIASEESMFYASLPTNSRKPDNIFTGSRALEKGECGFAYIAGLASTDNPSTPIALWPLVPGKRLFDYQFAKKYNRGKAVILRLDHSVSSLPIDKSGHIYLVGKDLLDPTNLIWGDKPPDIKWPK